MKFKGGPNGAAFFCLVWVSSMLHFAIFIDPYGYN